MYTKKIFICVFIILIMVFSSVLVYAQEIGNASWYGENFQGRLTASGEIYDMDSYTAAHKLYEFGTLLKVTNLENNKSVIVRVNDRGPYVGNRIIDLSKKAFADIASLDEGIIEVSVELADDDEMIEEDFLIDDESEDMEGISDTLTLEEAEDEDEVYTYRIQFGAFIVKENALNLAKELIDNGIKVKVYKVKYKSGKVLYKIFSDQAYTKLKRAYLDIDKYQTMGYDCFVVKLNF
jgi:rare lipoprotein A